MRGWTAAIPASHPAGTDDSACSLTFLHRLGRRAPGRAGPATWLAGGRPARRWPCCWRAPRPPRREGPAPIQIKVVGGLASISQYVRYEAPFWTEQGPRPDQWPHQRRDRALRPQRHPRPGDAAADAARRGALRHRPAGARLGGRAGAERHRPADAQPRHRQPAADRGALAAADRDAAARALRDPAAGGLHLPRRR